MRPRKRRTSLVGVVLVALIAAGGGVATALFVVPRATGALRAVTAANVYADPDEADAAAGEAVEVAAGEGGTGEPEIPVGEPARGPADAEHEREQLSALPPPAGGPKLATNPTIVLDDVEIQVIEGSRPWVIHRLVAGETLEQVAWRYEVTTKELRTWNGLAADAKPVRFRVTVDGKPPGDSHGMDVDANGEGTVTDQRLYQLVRQNGPVEDRTFEIRFLGEGVQAYAFTFG